MGVGSKPDSAAQQGRVFPPKGGRPILASSLRAPWPNEQDKQTAFRPERGRERQKGGREAGSKDLSV